MEDRIKRKIDKIIDNWFFGSGSMTDLREQLYAFAEENLTKDCSNCKSLRFCEKPQRQEKRCKEYNQLYL